MLVSRQSIAAINIHLHYLLSFVLSVIYLRFDLTPFPSGWLKSFFIHLTRHESIYQDSKAFYTCKLFKSNANIDTIDRLRFYLHAARCKLIAFLLLLCWKSSQPTLWWFNIWKYDKFTNQIGGSFIKTISPFSNWVKLCVNNGIGEQVYFLC